MKDCKYGLKRSAHKRVFLLRFLRTPLSHGSLELAAARVRLLTPATLLSRLDQALSAGWARNMPKRQRTMQAALDWSYDLLSEPEKGLFERLSVFAGGFTLEAADTVGPTGEVADEEVLDLLGSLVEQSLVTAKPDPESAEARYGMLEPIKQYALERLEASGKPSKQGGVPPPFSLSSPNCHTVSLWGHASWSGWSAWTGRPPTCAPP